MSPAFFTLSKTHLKIAFHVTLSIFNAAGWDLTLSFLKKYVRLNTDQLDAEGRVDLYCTD